MLYFLKVSQLHFTPCESKATPVLAWTGPQVSRRLRLPEYLEHRHVEVVRLSAIITGRFYPLPPPGDIPGIYFC